LVFRTNLQLEATVSDRVATEAANAAISAKLRLCYYSAYVEQAKTPKLRAPKNLED